MMKKRLVLFTVFMLLIIVVAAMLPVGAESSDTTETEQLDVTDSYYYDRLSEEQKTYYIYLKEFLDTWDVEPGSYQIDLSHLLGQDDTEANAEQMVRDFMYVQIALHADEPLYKWKGSFVGGGAYCDFDGNIVFLADFDKFEIYTDEVQARTDARISEIVEAIGEGDRYTKLRRMVTYFMDNTFYDPYLGKINSQGSGYFELRGLTYDTSAYGLFLEGVSMCDGFSQAVKIICNEIDVPCIIMGNSKHAWNLVQMEDGRWYRVDITNACRLGWDGVLSDTYEQYFSGEFLNNNTFGAADLYNDPYMISLDNVPLVTEFPEHAEGRYVYMGSETNFSYADVESKLELGESKFIYRVNADGVSCTIINHEGKESGDLIIPESIDGYTVTAIAPYAFYYCSDFKGRLVIPDTVESIQRAAFAGCYGITSVELPQSLHVIGTGAFIGCKGISNIKFPSITGVVSDYAFYDCDSLNMVTFGDHIFSLEKRHLDK